MSLVFRVFRGLSRVACFHLFSEIYFLLYFMYSFVVLNCDFDGENVIFFKVKFDFFFRLFFVVFACFQRIIRVFHRESWQHWFPS